MLGKIIRNWTLKKEESKKIIAKYKDAMIKDLFENGFEELKKQDQKIEKYLNGFMETNPIDRIKMHDSKASAYGWVLVTSGIELDGQEPPKEYKEFFDTLRSYEALIKETEPRIHETHYNIVKKTDKLASKTDKGIENIFSNEENLKKVTKEVFASKEEAKQYWTNTMEAEIMLVETVKGNLKCSDEILSPTFNAMAQLGSVPAKIELKAIKKELYEHIDKKLEKIYN